MTTVRSEMRCSAPGLLCVGYPLCSWLDLRARCIIPRVRVATSSQVINLGFLFFFSLGEGGCSGVGTLGKGTGGSRATEIMDLLIQVSLFFGCIYIFELRLETVFWKRGAS